MLDLEGQTKMEEMRFSRFWKMAKDSAAGIELGSSFHQMGKVNEKKKQIYMCIYIYIYIYIYITN